MWETYRMLGSEREQELLREARRLQALSPFRQPRKESLMKNFTIASRIVLVLAALVLIAVAFAASGLATPNRGAGPVPTADLVERWLALQSTAPRPDDRSGVRGIPSIARAETAAPAPDLVFQWSDAGVGAGTTVAILLIAGGGFAMARRAARRKRLLSRTT
jgi:hypothetical protein